MTLDEFLQQPYEKRQLIIINSNVSEPTAKSTKTAINELTTKFQKEPLKYLYLMAGVPLGVAATLIGAGIGVVLEELLKDKERITFIPMDHALKLSLPAGRVKEGNIYIGHPIESQYRFYYPLHEFHTSLHRQKSRELVRILRSLQLTHFRFRHVEGYRDLSSRSMDFSAKVYGTQVGSGGSQKKETNCDYDVIWEESYDPSEEKPKLPDGLIWFNYEDEWQLAMEGALQDRMKAMKFKYSYKNDFGVDVDWNLVLDKAKIKAKTHEQEFQRTEWDITIER